MTVITEQNIIETYADIMSKITAILPMEKWNKRPVKLVIEDIKDNHGIALPDGTIQISNSYLGTTANEALKETITHELCHFAVGLKHGHDNYFKKVLDGLLYRLGISEEDAQSQKWQATKNRNHKWTILATLEDGSRHFFGVANRRSKKNIEYHLQSKYKILWGEPDENKGKTITKLEYVAN